MRFLTIDAEQLRRHLPPPAVEDKAWPVVLVNDQSGAVVLVRHVHERLGEPGDFSDPWLVFLVLGLECEYMYEWQLTDEGFIPYPFEVALCPEDERGPFRCLHVDVGTGELTEPGRIGLAAWARTAFIFSDKHPEWRAVEPEGEFTVAVGFEAAMMQLLYEYRLELMQS